MSDETPNRVTLVLQAVNDGRAGATDELFELLYDQLRQLAGKRMAQEKSGQTLQATALVNEAFLRLVGSDSVEWANRRHFFAAASEAMRRILIDIARRKKAKKHGAGALRFELSEGDKLVYPVADELLDLDAALTKLEEADPVKAKLVKLRFFAGFTTAEAAKVLDIGVSTAERYWTYAKAWLHQEVAR